MYEYIIRARKNGTATVFTSDKQLLIGETIWLEDQEYEVMEDIT